MQKWRRWSYNINAYALCICNCYLLSPHFFSPLLLSLSLATFVQLCIVHLSLEYVQFVCFVVSHWFSLRSLLLHNWMGYSTTGPKQMAYIQVKYYHSYFNCFSLYALDCGNGNRRAFTVQQQAEIKFDGLLNCFVFIRCLLRDTQSIFKRSDSIIANAESHFIFVLSENLHNRILCCVVIVILYRPTRAPYLDDCVGRA